MLFRTRVVHFWTRILSGLGDVLRAGSEECDDWGIANGEGSKGRWPDRFLAYNLYAFTSWRWFKNILLNFFNTELFILHYFLFDIYKNDW